MAYILNGTSIRAPFSIDESNDTQVSQVRTLSGTIARDYFGSNKRVWRLNYRTTKKEAFDVIDAIYDAYVASATPVSWQVTETNYTIASTTVHVDLPKRDFSMHGSDYISDFELILTEA